MNYAALDRDCTLARAVRQQRRTSEFQAAAITLNRRLRAKTSPLPGCATPATGADPYRSLRLRRKTEPAAVVILEPIRHRTAFDLDADEAFGPCADEAADAAADLDLSLAIGDAEVIEALNWPVLQHEDWAEENPFGNGTSLG